MEHDDHYEAWRRARSDADVPDGFADRVMAAIRERGQTGERSALCAVVLAVVASRAGRIVLWSLACAVGVVRVGSVIALFLVR